MVSDLNLTRVPVSDSWPRIASDILIEIHMPRIGVVKLGGPAWPRYALHDERWQYWSGAGWVEDVRRAVLFADERSAAIEYERVVGLTRAGQPVKEYTARVSVRVVGDEQYDLSRLTAYLATCSRLHLDPDTVPGPVPDAGVTVVVEWGGLTERTESPGGGA